MDTTLKSHNYVFISSFIFFFTFVELNCENLFDTVHDSLKNDTEFLPESDYHWTRTRYWKKINHLSQEIIALGELPTPYYIYNGSLSQSKKNQLQGKGRQNQWHLPDLVALCEVENDSAMIALTRRSLLRKAGYEYVMTSSPDERGIDVALMYQPFHSGCCIIMLYVSSVCLKLVPLVIFFMPREF